MNNSMAIGTEQNARLNTHILLKFVLAYEDYVTGTRARIALDKVIRGLGDRFAFVRNTWKFTVLDLPYLREIASAEAAEADMVIIAAYEGRDLPPAVHSWLDSWISRRNGEGGCLLALLIDYEDQLQPGAPAPVCNYLRSLAAKAKMDYLTQKIEGPNPEIEVAPQNLENDDQKVMQCWGNFLRALRMPENN